MRKSSFLVCLSILAIVLAMMTTGCGKKGGDDAAVAGGPEAAGGPGGPAGGPTAGAPPGGPAGGPTAGAPPGGPAAGGPGGPGGPAMGGPGGPGGPGAGGPGGPGGAEAGGPGGPGGPGMGGPGGPGGADAGGPGGGPAGAEAEKIEKPKMDPAEVSANLAEAMQAKKAGDLDGALKLTSEVLRARPENVEANWLTAWLLADKDDTALAIGQFERVMKLGLDAEKTKQAGAALKRLKSRQN